MSNNCEMMVLMLDGAEIDPRTGNKVVYGASWVADRKSMIGTRNENWVRRELEWFRSGSNLLIDLEDPVPKAFQECAGFGSEVNSAYGYILFNKKIFSDGTTIFSRAVDALKTEGLATRHAVCVITDRDIHRLATEKGKNDFICTNALNIMVDHKNRLHIFAQMRSMDAVWGYRADYSMWKLLQKMLLWELKDTYPQLKAGNLMFQVANLHVYPRHLRMLEDEADGIYEKISRRVWKDNEDVQSTR